MIGFVVRRCSVALGRRPTPAEFALWANTQGTPPNTVCLFGRPISESEAAVILGHQARLVTARSAAAEEQIAEYQEWLRPAVARPASVTSLEEVRGRSNGARPPARKPRWPNGRGPVGAR